MQDKQDKQVNEKKGYKDLSIDVPDSPKRDVFNRY